VARKSKGKAPKGRGAPRPKARTEQELTKLGRAVAKAANSLGKGSGRGPVTVRIIGCLARMPPWCLPTDMGKVAKPVWIAIRRGKKPPPRAKKR